jgi:hypothetical protein
MRLQQGAEDGDPAEEAEGAAGLGVPAVRRAACSRATRSAPGRASRRAATSSSRVPSATSLTARSAAALATRVMRRRSMKAPMKAMPAAMVRPSPAPRAAIREVVERIGSCRPVRPEDALAGCSGRILDRAQ